MGAAAESAQAPGLLRTEPAPPGVRYDDAWLGSVLRPLLIGVMVAALNIALGAFLARFLPDTPPGLYSIIVVLGVLAAVIACISTAWLAQPDQRINRTAAYRGAEIALIVMLVRLALWSIPGMRPTLNDLFLHPLDTIFDGYFIVAGLIVLFSWFWAIDFSTDLLGMALQADEYYLADATLHRGLDSARPAGANRRALLDRFTTRWMIGGLILVALAAGSQVEMTGASSWSLLRQPIDPLVISSIIVYFFAGLLLISQGQLAMLRARWTLERVPATEAISRNWPLYVLGLLGALGVVAAFLPLGGTYRLSLVLAAIINGLYFAVYTVYRILFLLLLALLSLLPFSNQEITPPAEAPPAEPPPPIQFVEPLPLVDWAGGLLFWIVTALLLGYAALLYFGAHKTGMDWLVKLWRRIKTYWELLTGSLRNWQPTRMGQTSGEPADAGQRRFRLRQWIEQLRSGRLTPEQRIRYYYLAMLEQAARFGAPRDDAETPAHFAPRLNHALEEENRRADDAVEALTAEFEQIRYAGSAASPDEAARMADLFRHIRAALRR